MITSVSCARFTKNGQPWGEMHQHSDPSATRKAVPDATTKKLLAQFCVPEIRGGLRRMTDNELIRPTTHTYDGRRFTYAWPSSTTPVEWCLLTAPVRKKGFVVRRNAPGVPSHGDALATFDLNATDTGRTALLFRSKEAATAALEAGLEVYLQTIHAGAREAEQERCSRITIHEVPVAADELRCAVIYKSTLALRWGKKKDPQANAQ